MYLAVSFISYYCMVAAFSPFLSILLKDLGYSHSIIGILMGIFSLAGIIGPFIFGYFADERGRYRAPLVIAHILTLVMLFPLTLSGGPFFTGIVLILMSLGYNSILPLAEAITTISIGSAGNYGKIRTPGSLGYILAILLLQFTPVLRPNTRFHIVIWSIVFGFISLLVIANIPARYTNVSRSRSDSIVPSNRNAPGDSKSIWSPLLIMGLLIISFSRLALSGAQGFFSIYVVDVLNWDAIGLLNAIAALSEVPFLFFSKQIIDRFGGIKCLAVGCLGVLIRLLILVLFPSPAGAVASQMLHSISYGLFHPAALAFIASCVPPNKRALGMSLYLAIGTTLPNLLGNIAGGFIVDHLGFPVLYGSFALFPLVSIALCMVISLQRRRAKKQC